MAAALVGVAFVVQLPTVPIGRINVPGVLFGLLAATGVAAFSALGGRDRHRQYFRVCRI